MITNFALSLSLEGIELFHRVPRGWRSVGRVDLTSPTLEDDLSALRKKALVIEPDGLRSKVVIPLDQIKYMALDGTLTTNADIDAALDGATPYALTDLVVDCEKSGGRTHVAAVARDTLQEAEEFAAAHGFQPVAFVAIPEPFTFKKELFFGPTVMARSIVGPDAIIDRDDLPVLPVDTPLKSRVLVFGSSDDTSQDDYKDDLAALLAEQPQAPLQAMRQSIWIDRIPAQYHAPAAVPVAAIKPQVKAAPALATPVLYDPVLAEHHPQKPKAPKPARVAVAGTAITPPPVASKTPTPKPATTPASNNRPALIAAGIAAAVVVLGGVIWSQQDTGETPVDAPVIIAEPVQDPAPAVTETELAVIAPEPPTPSVLGAPIAPGQVLSPDEADRFYAATGVWLRAPRFFDEPTGVIAQDFTPPAQITAPARIAQPDLPRDDFETDLSFLAPPDPPAPEVIFARDENGFIQATPEGTLTPEGALVFAGLPELAITLRPALSADDVARMALLAPAPEGVVIVTGAPDVVPPLRPENAVLPDTQEETIATAPQTASPGGVGLGGLDLQNSGTISLDPGTVEERALVDLRPRLRPQGLAPAEDPGTPDITDILADIQTDDGTLRFDNSTSLAVVLSTRPVGRPSNFSNVVAAATARRQTQPAAPAPAAPVVAAAPPPPPQNSNPVPGGVARAATQEGAIRLRDINLIGVYGRPNARRALVRLGNGRYVRVEVGSELDGGEVSAIGDSALNYVKRGRTYALELP